MAEITNKKKSLLANGYVLRLIINGIVVAMLFSLVEKFIVPLMEWLLKSVPAADIACWVLSIIFSAPFIWAMLFSYKLDLHAQHKPRIKKIIIWLGWLMSLSEVILLSFAYTDVGLPLLFLFLLATILLIAFSRYLQNIYCWFENSIVKNITRTFFLTPQEEKEETDEVQPLELVIIHIQADHPHLGKSIADREFLTSIKGSIVGLERNGKRHFHIDATMILQDLDVLYIIKDE